jgi:DNA-binding CsgD family transcriptional regulator
MLDKILQQNDKEKSDVAHRADILSEREVEILTWSAHGKTYSEISIMLSISEDTVKDHLERVGRKLNTTNKTHTVAVALSRGLIKL